MEVALCKGLLALWRTMFRRKFHVRFSIKERTLPWKRLQWLLCLHSEFIGADVWTFVYERVYFSGVLSNSRIVSDSAAALMVPGCHSSFSIVHLVSGALEFFDPGEHWLGLAHSFFVTGVARDWNINVGESRERLSVSEIGNCVLTWGGRLSTS